MTFSIAARDGDAWGVAVASKFLAVGSVVPAVRPGVGAVATQSLARVAYLDEVLDALAAGTDVAAALGDAVAADEGRALRRSARSVRPAPRPSPVTAASPGPAGSPRRRALGLRDPGQHPDRAGGDRGDRRRPGSGRRASVSTTA